MDSTATKLLIILPIVLISMTLHEMMHAFASYRLGDDTAYLQGRLSFNPLRHIDPFLTLGLPLLLVLLGSTPFGAAKPVQVNFSRLRHREFGAALVGMVGPLTNLLIAVLAALILRHFVIVPVLVFKILGYSILVNVGFFIFNSVPWPPLDGSRLLYAFAPRSLQELMERIEGFGINGLVIYMFLFLTVFQQPMSDLIIRLSSYLSGGLIT